MSSRFFDVSSKIPRSAYVIFTVLIVIFSQFVLAKELEIIVESEECRTRDWAAKTIPFKRTFRSDLFLFIMVAKIDIQIQIAMLYRQRFFIQLFNVPHGFVSVANHY